MCKFALSEVDKTWLFFATFCFGVFTELINDLSKIGKTLINLAKLFQALAFCIGVINFLTACEINDMESTCSHDFFAVFLDSGGLDKCCKHSM